MLTTMKIKKLSYLISVESNVNDFLTKKISTN